MIKFKYLAPFVILFVLSILLWRGLFYSTQNKFTSDLIGSPLPPFRLKTIDNNLFSETDLIGQVALLNFWATWCYACQQEHALLKKIHDEYHLPIYGIIYRDDKDQAKAWLEKNGNPFVLIGDDNRGNVAVDFGIYGTPETYVINADGKIVYRYVGALKEEDWKNILLPLVVQLSQAQTKNYFRKSYYG